MDENEFDILMDDYLLPAAVVPLDGWDIDDLVTLYHQIDAELQKRYDAGQQSSGAM